MQAGLIENGGGVAVISKWLMTWNELAGMPPNVTPVVSSVPLAANPDPKIFTWAGEPLPSTPASWLIAVTDGT